MNRRCIIGQSGGPTVAINATLAGVIKECFKKNYDKVYGMVNGLSGFLDGRIIELDEFKNEDSLQKLIHTPAMYLGSCRFKISENDQALMRRIFNILNEMKITDFFYIGGNDSMDTIKKLSHYGKTIKSDIHFIGIPKTIDNDLMKTEYTPGYPSACHYVATSLLEIAFDSSIYPLKSVTIIEIMGRDAGWLTAAAQLVNEVYHDTVDLIYMPEVTFDKDDFIEDVKTKLEGKNNVIVAVSEGIRDKYGMCISLDSGIMIDDFGHVSNSGCSYYLKKFVSNQLDCKVRAIQLSTLQRCAAHLSSSVDLKNAVNIGEYAVKCALDNKTAIMISMCFNRSEFILNYVSIDLVANLVKKFPLNWIDFNHKTIRKEYIDYVVPLIYESGKIELPQFCRR